MKARSLRCVGAARVLLSHAAQMRLPQAAIRARVKKPCSAGSLPQCCGLEWLLMQMRWAVDCVLCSASPSSRGFAA